MVLDLLFLVIFYSGFNLFIDLHEFTSGHLSSTLMLPEGLGSSIHLKKSCDGAGTRKLKVDDGGMYGLEHSLSCEISLVFILFHLELKKSQARQLILKN